MGRTSGGGVVSAIHQSDAKVSFQEAQKKANPWSRKNFDLLRTS